MTVATEAALLVQRIDRPPAEAIAARAFTDKRPPVRRGR